MAITILAPEIIAGIAFDELTEAKSSIKEMYSLGYEDWTSTYGFFVSMGGFVIRFDDGTYHSLYIPEIIACIRSGHCGVVDFAISKEGI